MSDAGGGAAVFGVFARVFPAGEPAGLAARVAAAGYTTSQLNLSALGLPTIPAAQEWTGIDPEGIEGAFGGVGVGIWGLSCTYNLAHPDASVRDDGTARAIELIGRAPRFGARAATLCTGSRDPERMWRAHPDNDGPEAWRDMRAQFDRLLPAAEAAGILLGVEPEPGNVIRDARAADRLLRELGADAGLIGIILDSANLLSAPGTPLDRAGQRAVLEEAVGLLGPSIACLHAKDLVPWTETLAGRGVVDYETVADLWRTLPGPVPIIVQDATADDAERVRRWLVERVDS